MSIYTRIAAVTGSNKGIGLACVRNLALQYPTSTFNNGPLLIYLTARDQKRGEEAVRAIHEDPQLRAAKALRSQGGLTDIKFLRLEIDDNIITWEFINDLKKQHPDGIDVFINNAGVAFDGFNADLVKKTLLINYHSTWILTSMMHPHMRDGGRMVTIASAVGHLNSSYAPSIRERFANATTTKEISDLMGEFTTAVKNGTHESQWPTSAYAVSKAGIIASTRILALNNAKRGSSVLLNSCCPGYVNTDMSKGRGVKTPDEGAQTPVMLALGDIKGANGEFWTEGRAVEWRT